MGFLGGGGGGGGGEASSQPTYTRPTNPQPVSPYYSAGGGFMGRTPFGSIGSASSVPSSRFNADYYLAQNPDVAADPYYGSNPLHHYEDFGFTERRSPSEGFQYAPSQQAAQNPAYIGRTDQNLVNMAYQNILGRAPTAYDSYVMGEQMRQGLTGQGLVSFGTTSPEFQRRQEYNRAYTEAFRPGYQEFGPSGQYYQPIYQSQYTNYSRAPGFYQPSYNPFSYGGGGGGYGGMGGMSGGYGSFYAEGGEVDDAEDEGIAALRNE